MTELLTLIDQQSEDTELLLLLARIFISQKMRFKSDSYLAEYPEDDFEKIKEHIRSWISEIEDIEVKEAVANEINRVEQLLFEVGAAHALAVVQVIDERISNYLADGREAPSRIKQIVDELQAELRGNVE